MNNTADITEYGLVRRFLHLLSAEMVEGIVASAFFLVLAWKDPRLYGLVMYGLATGDILRKVVEFGMYFPLVRDIGGAERGKVPGLLATVNTLKIMLFAPAVIVFASILHVTGTSRDTLLTALVIGAGFALRSFAETFFADLRVRGRQEAEARVLIMSTALAFSYGFVCLYFNAGPLTVAFYAVLQALLQLVGVYLLVAKGGGAPFLRFDLQALRSVFKTAVLFGMIEVLGALFNKANIFFLEHWHGPQSVAYYSATWNIISLVSVLISAHFLNRVLYPHLSALWQPARAEAFELVRRQARWLFAVACPVMLVLYVESGTIIGTVYPAGFADAVWMQKLLVPCVLLAFESNLFRHVMMVAGSMKILLGIHFAATIINFALSYLLVSGHGLGGACLAIVATKFFMLAATFTYCQFRFALFDTKDLTRMLVLPVIFTPLVVLSERLMGTHLMLLVTLPAYLASLWRFGEQLLGSSRVSKM